MLNTPQIRLPREALFAAKGRDTVLDELVALSLELGRGLRLSIDGAEAVIALQPGPSTRVALGVQWRSALLEGRPKTPGALLLVPLLAWVQTITIPPHALVTQGTELRSPADVFLRNFFHAACRGDPVEVAERPPDARKLPLSRELANHYRWLLKAHFPEALFAQADAASVLIAAAHLTVHCLEQALLRQGLDEYRARVAARAGDGVATAQRERFAELRRTLSNHWRP